MSGMDIETLAKEIDRPVHVVAASLIRLIERGLIEPSDGKEQALADLEIQARRMVGSQKDPVE